MAAADICSYVYEAAKKMEIRNNFNIEKEVAGKTWFTSRHPELSLRKSEPTTAARAQGFCKEAVDQFYDLLERIYDQHNIPASNIYNIDETGISIVPSVVVVTMHLPR